MGFLHRLFGGHARDLEKATESARWWDPKALNDLALKHIIGEGVRKDHRKAMELLTRSAELGYASAQYSLGNAYYLGDIAPAKDYVRAYAWFNLFAASARRGRWMGAGQRDDLEKLMTPEQIAEAKSLSIELQARIDATKAQARGSCDS